MSEFLKSQGVQLEKRAVDALGSVISDAGNQFGSGTFTSRVFDAAANTVRTGGGLGSGIIGAIKDGASDILNSTIFGGADGIWQSPKYAESLLKFAPKNKFLFKVEFVFEGSFSFNREFMYVVKSVDRPKVAFEYEEVNMYNFKTKVLRSVKHEALGLVFHDDIQNKVLDFFNEYRKLYSPVSKMHVNQKSMYEESGMDFGPNNHDKQSGSASTGALPHNRKGVLSHMILTQVFAHGSAQTRFTFINPRIEQFDFDNVDSDTSDPNTLSINFSYDGLYVDTLAVAGTPAPIFPHDMLGSAEQGKPMTLSNRIGENTAIPGIKNPLDAFTGAVNDVTSGIKSAVGGIASSVNSVFSMQAQNTLSSMLPSALQNTSQATAGLRDGVNSIKSFLA